MYAFVFFQSLIRRGIIGSTCSLTLKVSTVLREKCYDLWRNWIYFMKIEILPPRVQISPIMVLVSSWNGSIPQFHYQSHKFKTHEIWSKHVLYWALFLEILTTSSLINFTLSRLKFSFIAKINYLVVERLGLEEFAWIFIFQIVCRHA